MRKTVRDKEIEEQLNRKLSILRDYVRGVAHRHMNGLYIYGRPGSSKTWTVKTTLDLDGVEFVYHNGHLTALGLFELLESNLNSIIFLDDVTKIFADEIGGQIFLAALGDQPPKINTKKAAVLNSPSTKEGQTKAKKRKSKAKPTATAVMKKSKKAKNSQSSPTTATPTPPQGSGRIVTYRRHGIVRTIRFTGAIIAISNIELHKKGLMEAIRSRVTVYNYDPNEEHMRLLIMQVAELGHTSAQGYTISKEQCIEIASFLIEESINLGVRLDLRNLTHKAYPAFIQWTLGKSENHWRDLVRHGLVDQASQIQTESDGIRQNQKLTEHMIVRMLFDKHKGDRGTIIAEWCKLTGKSDRAIYRRMTELGLKF